jgi:hypothetical protein
VTAVPGTVVADAAPDSRSSIAANANTTATHCSTMRFALV